MLRMRQICLVARELEQVMTDLTAILGLEVSSRSPELKGFGVQNVMLPVGNNFLEVVAPIEGGTAAGRHLDRRGGDGGYMVITQCDDVDVARDRVTSLGMRPVYDDGRGIQLHPRDVPGAIVELRQDEGGEDPAGPWWPAGENWIAHRRLDATRAITAAEVQSDDPVALGTRWSEVLDRPVEASPDGRVTIALDDATLRFVEASDGRGVGLGGLDVDVVDATSVLREAEARGCTTDDHQVTICGVRFRLV